MRKILSLLLITVLLLCVGCSKQTPDDSSVIDVSIDDLDIKISSDEKNNDDNSLEANNIKKPPNEKFIINDLKKKDINAFELNYCYERLDVDSLEIIKRKTEDDMDTVYVSVVFKNTAYTVNADITLYYSFYTVGGWILDNYEIANYQSSAIQPYYTDEEFISYINENFYNGKIQNRNHGLNNDGIYYDEITFSASYDYYYATANIICKYYMYFVNDIWHSEGSFDNVMIDWSRMKGCYAYTNDHLWWGATSLKTNLMINIEQIEQLKNTESSGFESGGIRFAYSGHSYLYSLSDSQVITDEEIPLKIKTVETKIITETIMGMQLDLPVVIDQVRHSIFVPFFQNHSIIAKLDVKDGIYSSDIEYSKDLFVKIS